MRKRIRHASGFDGHAAIPEIPACDIMQNGIVVKHQNSSVPNRPAADEIKGSPELSFL